jgi:hypothetical protein
VTSEDFTVALGTALGAAAAENKKTMTGDGPKSKPTTMNKNATFGKAFNSSGQTDPAFLLELFPAAIVGEFARTACRSHTPFSHHRRSCTARKKKESSTLMNTVRRGGDFDPRRLVHILRRHKASCTQTCVVVQSETVAVVALRPDNCLAAVSDVTTGTRGSHTHTGSWRGPADRVANRLSRVPPRTRP